jgi:hypothetical protein
MNIPDSRAAAKRSPKSDDDRILVHAVLLNDPVKRWNGHTVKRLKSLHEPLYLNYWEAAEAICSRRVRLVYAMSFHPEDDDACPDCKRLVAILQFAPEQYPTQARLIEQQVQERERLTLERKNAQREAKRLFGAVEAVDESDEEEPPPDLMDLLKRADHDDPDTERHPTIEGEAS